MTTSNAHGTAEAVIDSAGPEPAGVRLAEPPNGPKEAAVHPKKKGPERSRGGCGPASLFQTGWFVESLMTILLITMLCYMGLTQVIKVWLLAKRWI